MATQQYNLKMPQRLALVAKEYAQRYGYKNIQELALDSLREKIYEKSLFDEEVTSAEITLIDEVISTISKSDLVSEAELSKVLDE